MYDGTPRPGWAGPVKIISEKAEQRKARSDVRAAISAGELSDSILRPVSISGIVVPCGTKGRKTKDVEGRDLKHAPEDRGHVFALSLGGPDTTAQMVSMPKTVNRDAKPAATGISWRQMEILVSYNASQSMKTGGTELPWTSQYIQQQRIKKSKEVKRTKAKREDPAYLPNPSEFKQILFVENKKVELPDVQSLAATYDRTRTENLTHIELQLTYSSRGNDPSSIKAVIRKGTALLPPSEGPIVFERSFNMEHGSSTYEIAGNKEAEAGERAREKRNAEEYAKEHLRKRSKKG